ncbi:hypothetical protein [Streptococcus gordonii]|uniref:hypothetical protein n=1 Tax=Streptococcus gordonii TaxID=1302 RepID=UPI00094979FE|nr:hypothetical protein [Streptococcus gordonii]MBZ2123870.1 hypothetical protein [Streptococcus gordonii]WAM21423.1 hypothetical protein OFA61_01650 [Streptococcus gordonii]
MIYSFSLRFIRVAGLAWPATKKKLFVFTTFLFYQEGPALSNHPTLRRLCHSLINPSHIIPGIIAKKEVLQ